MAKYPYQKNCEYCKQDFTIQQSWQKTKKFCTNPCATSSYRIHTRETVCVHCSSPLRPGQFKFCSKSCTATHTNVKRGSRSLDTRAKISATINRNNNNTPTEPYDPTINNCLNCGNLCKQRTLKYCSKVCAHTVIQTRNCIICGCEFQGRPGTKTCEKHKTRYNMKEREVYEFRFNVYKFPELFDLEMLTRIGFKNRQNLNGIVRDHKVSIADAKKYNYDPYYISHVMNCQLITAYHNLRKNSKSSITYQELVNLVDEYDSQNQPVPGHAKLFSSPP